MSLLAVTLLFGVSSSMLPETVQAAETGTYEAAIWINPDGCEHWILDLSVEGVISSHLDRAGNTVCDRNPYILIEFRETCVRGEQGCAFGSLYQYVTRILHA